MAKKKAAPKSTTPKKAAAKPKVKAPKKVTVKPKALVPSKLPGKALDFLENVCSFVIGTEPSGLDMLPESAEYKLIGGDGMGGCFYFWQSQELEGRVPVVYLSQYGETTRFADDFTDALIIVTAFPSYWCDLLVAAHKGGDRVERVIKGNEEDLDEEYAEAREELRKLLKLDIASAKEKFVVAVTRTPAFMPTLTSRKGPMAASSFSERPFPK